MKADSPQVQRAVEWLRSGKEEQQYQAILALRCLSAEPENKDLIREQGGIQELIKLLDSGPEACLTIVATETIACLVADDPANRELLRHHEGVEKLVQLLFGGPDSESTHRALLAVRILTDKEVDRMAILRAGGIEPLVELLSSGPESEITEYAAAALGNLAAGSQRLKDAIRQAGGIEPLVKLLRQDPDEISAELAAVVLRNLSLQNPQNRSEIQTAGGVQPLLRLLSMGQETLLEPLPCMMEYTKMKAWGPRTKTKEGKCCFDPSYGHLCVALEQTNTLNCFGSSQSSDPRDRTADRYSLLRKLSIAEPDPQSLELSFGPSDKDGGGVKPVDKGGKSKSRRIHRLFISPCNATEVKASIMRMLTRMHLENEFKKKPEPQQSRPNISQTGSDDDADDNSS
eukprot:g4581.t1